MAVVLLGTNEPPDLYPYEVVCLRGDDGWDGRAESNSCGWTEVFDPDGEGSIRVETAWGEAPAGATEIAISFSGGACRVPVVDGYYFWVAWDVPGVGFPMPPGDVAGWW
jgi:hypothetical protein